MIPFSPVPFVKERPSVSLEQPNKVEKCSFDGLVPTTTSKQSSGKRKCKKKDTCLIKDTKVEHKKLFRLISYDDVNKVKSWVENYYNKCQHDHQEVIIASDGCTVLMEAIAYKSYQCLSYLLPIFSHLLNESDNYGNTIFSMADKLEDPSLYYILEQTDKQMPAQKPKTPFNQDPNSAQASSSKSGLYCNVCRVKYQDSSHISSIDHLFNEKRPILDVNPFLDPNSVGYKIMSKSGWDESSGLGPSGKGRKHLIKTCLKTDRRGIGMKDTAKPKVTQFRPGDTSAVKGTKISPSHLQTSEPRRKRQKRLDKDRQWEIRLRRYMND